MVGVTIGLMILATEGPVKTSGMGGCRMAIGCCIEGVHVLVGPPCNLGIGNFRELCKMRSPDRSTDRVGGLALGLLAAISLGRFGGKRRLWDTSVMAVMAID